MRKVFRIIHEISVLGGKLSAQYTKNGNWAESFPLNHKFGTTARRGKDKAASRQHFGHVLRSKATRLTGVEADRFRA